jgi:hypothetical protein
VVGEPVIKFATTTVVEAEAEVANVNINPVVTSIDVTPTFRLRNSVALTDRPLRMVFTAFVIVHEDASIAIGLDNDREFYHPTCGL